MTDRSRQDTEKAERVDHGKISNLIAATIEDAQSLKTFVLKLEGNALVPDFIDGDLLTIAPDVLPLPGDAVVAIIQGKYGCMRVNADGDLWDNKGGFVPRGFYEIAGVVLDRTPKETRT